MNDNENQDEGSAEETSATKREVEGRAGETNKTDSTTVPRDEATGTTVPRDLD
jgi:hypothetical protein